MKSIQTKQSNGSLRKFLILSLGYLFLAGGTGFSQDNNAVWLLQVDSYSHHVGLKKSASKKLAKEYIAFREEVGSGKKEIPGDLTEEQYDMAEEKVITQSRQDFNLALGKILKTEQQAGALLVLGSLNSRWESYLKILIGFNLQDADLERATSLVCTYMVQYLEARAEAEKANTRFSSVTANSLKGALDSGLSEILSDGQKADWETRTARKRRQ